MSHSEQELVLTPGQGIKHYWRDLWDYRELFLFLAWRDITVRYKQTAIGVAWSVIQPIMAMVIFSVVFGRLAKLPSGGIPYPVLVFAAMMPWQLFANGLSQSSNSLIGNAQMISKIYFPRLALPASSIVVSLIDFMISFGMLVILLLFYRIPPTPRAFALPLFLLLALGAAMGGGLWMASLNVKYRDFRYIVPFVVQLGVYISPVGFSSSIIPERWRLLYSLNPMVGIIDGFRWAILGRGELYWPGLSLSAVLVVILLGTGLWHFRRTERTFADVI
jgi:lipopolysaccharide transport system permease protein